MDHTWVDPFEMNLNSESATERLAAKHVPILRSIIPSTCDANENLVAAYYKRIVNMILSQVSIDSQDDNFYKGYASINMPVESYDSLRKFLSSSNLGREQYEEVDRILMNAYQKSSMENLSNVMLSWQEYLYLTLTVRSVSMFVGAIFLLLLCIKLYRVKVTVWSVVKILIFLGWIVDFMFTWMHLYQTAEINKMVDILKLKSVPENCDPTKISVWTSIWQFISGSDECKQYHQAMYSDIFWGIGPFAVFSEQLLVPATNIGSAFGNVINGILGSLPWGVNIILLPVLLIFLCIIICLFLSFATDTNFELNLLHMIKFKFNSENRRDIGNVFYRIGDHVLHREMIEEVRLKGERRDEPVIKTNSSAVEGSEKSIAGKMTSSEASIGDTNPEKEKIAIQNVGSGDGPPEIIEEKNSEEKPEAISIGVQTSYVKSN